MNAIHTLAGASLISSVTQKPTIFPIALDLGAKSTGAYYARYARGVRLGEIEKKGEVLGYDNKNYTILLKERTIKRHQRRGYDRLQFAKRLLVLVLENYFKFPAGGHQQAIGFLMNRRGFSFLEKEFSEKHLNDLPDGVRKALPPRVREKLDGVEPRWDHKVDRRDDSF